MKNLIIASTSTVHGGTYLSYILPRLETFFAKTDEILFIPYARPGGISHDEYTEAVRKGFESTGKKITGIHTCADPVKAVNEAKAVFTGGGNTFLLVSQLYRTGIMEPLREAVWNGTRYFGTSAGANITGLTMQTTNDMPIIYPPSFKTLGLVPFNINPHYLDPLPGSKHMGETRETRIKEFHKQNTQPVVGLREGSWLYVEGDDITLEGALAARIFEQGKAPYELESGNRLNFWPSVRKDL
ncbi:dipeptidase PepE [Sinomicrobium weinanense]|uniref:Dipeptidase PepE n=1 Tax=Sinomicrobium weinanense TaxID=2842200 RepID=A0A926Q468_9FLAO|nr:dipeptidase PepE [Sinomicrobium weinanense]MBC9797649.1 dipeptidase PepE [Sinomicrobium weinanense]MBU3122669.1 dipeptidase PepE [Sinomicrobium weinanense]